MPSPTLLTSLLAIVTTASSTPTCPPHIGPQGVHARLPPTFNTSSHYERVWRAPPVGWYFKPWTMIYASNQQYALFRNLQYDPTPLDAANPAGLVNDLFSFQLRGNNTVYTSYGVDTPNEKYAAVLEYNGTGIIAGATSEYSLLAWGCDGDGVPYYASYSTETDVTGTPAGIDIMSTSEEGPDEATADALVKALKDLPDVEIQGLAANLTRMTQDGGRDGLPRATCDDYCKTNQNLIGILG